MSRIRNFLALLREQLWVIPVLMAAAALLLAYAMSGLGLDLAEPRRTELWWLYGGDMGTARDLLSTLLSGLMAMTSLVVSITFVVLTLAAGQLGPRMISTFIRDRQIQAVLGLFLATTLYVLVVLRSLDEALGPSGVPHLAVTGASALTVACLFALLFYVHKVARSIIADTIVRKVAGQLRSAVRAMLPEEGADTGDAAPRVGASLPRAGWVSLGRSGYVQTIDHEALVDVARRAGAVLGVTVRAGHFVLSRGEHVEVRSDSAVEERIADAIRAAFVVGPERSPAQDLEYAIRQLVEIALRALSPGINDPFTAVAVVDQLGAALEDVLARPAQPAVLRDAEGEARVIANRSGVEGLFDAALDQIRQAAGDHPAVLIHVADTLGKLAPVLGRDEARRAALEHLARLGETAEGARLAPGDRDATLARIGRARTAVEACPVSRRGSFHEEDAAADEKPG
jgi:uncharacterized membrane protein